ncbi:hypothetical protein GCM10022226_56490 [Sphaerisporangium flaviroseum]|uniref:Uncharacterized protein n=1 Tax=Sphaerisporangium flaviroseum TaxID=509199 RepID=A0ABP7IWU7_9ACTN
MADELVFDHISDLSHGTDISGPRCCPGKRTLRAADAPAKRPAGGALAKRPVAGAPAKGPVAGALAKRPTAGAPAKRPAGGRGEVSDGIGL